MTGASTALGSPFTLFEVSWEVANKVGGIHTVLATKARTLVERFGDDYVLIGPWLLAEAERRVPFVEDRGFEDFVESCRALGVPARVGRWAIPGRPRTILVEFSRLFERKDDVLAGLWERHRVDSISGQWDYVEPVLFGHAAGVVIERWWEEFLDPYHRRAVAHAHEWMTASALLHLARRVPAIGTVYTTHATVLGRSLSSLGHSPEDGLGDRSADELAEEHGVRAKHSMEGAGARDADVFTTVSQITAKEAELLHGRAPDPVLPNGIDLSVLDEIAGETPRSEARGRLRRLAAHFLGTPIEDQAFLCVSGRYEFHNKGIDLLLDALARLDRAKGRGVVLFVLVPAGNSGVRAEVRARMETALEDLEGPAGIATHNLADAENDPVAQRCRDLGLANATGARVHVIHLPVYLDGADGLLDLPYEAALRAMDLSCFPSYYEPWGYTPQESLAVGVPTITSDYAGFGRWAQSQGLGREDGISIVARVHVEYEEVVASLASEIEHHLRREPVDEALREACRRTAARASWTDLVANYERAWSLALEAVHARLARGVPLARRPRRAHAVRPAPEGGRPRLVTFDVAATLPYELRGLDRLAQNLWWSWDPEGPSLFEDISPDGFAACDRNPVAFLARAWPEDLAAKAADPEYVARLERVLARFDAHLAEGWRDWPDEDGAPAITADRPVAYLCAEYGLHPALRVYSGGLGALAGDHLKSASDLGLPLVAVGLFYRMGYLEQRLSAKGEQLAIDVENDPQSLPMRRVRGASGEPLVVTLELPGRELGLGAWCVRVGRVDLYLLDADLPRNRPEDRDVTRHLYGGDQETRLLQEIALGRGGVKLLRELGITPSVWHMNEGHAAFCGLQRVAELERDGLSFDEARELVRASTVFTTHTPVPAGHDRFGEDLMRRYFSGVEDWVGISWERFYAQGRAPLQAAEGDGEARAEFNMTYLALAFASRVNGVSALHGEVSRALLQPFWPGLLESESPVGAVTNGVHLPTWTDPAIARLLGATDRPVRGEDFARRAAEVPARELLRARRAAKERLFARVEERLRASFVRRHDSPLLLARTIDGLDPEALTIGFARRFAPYKRAHLLFQDRARLRALLDDAERPVRVLVAGKAHPRDERGVAILREIAEISRSDELAGRVFFLENYDLELASHLVRGVDVWLNNPTRMQEASGTSGMKAAANGVLHLSVGDGWWPEAFDGANGWVIGDGRAYEDQTLQDQLDGSVLYRLLEEEVVPQFFERDADGVPRAWVERTRRSLATIPPRFDTARMVSEYASFAYVPLARDHATLVPERYAAARSRVAELARVRRGFESVRIVSASMADLSDVKVGDEVGVRAEVDLGELAPEDVDVELVLGHRRGDADLVHPVFVRLETPRAPAAGGPRVYEGSHRIERSGVWGYGLRVRASGWDGERRSLAGLVRWA